MVIQILAAHASRAVSVRIIAPGENTRVLEILREEVAQPMHAVAGRPRPLGMAVEAVDRDNANILLGDRKPCASNGRTPRWGQYPLRGRASRGTVPTLLRPGVRAALLVSVWELTQHVGSCAEAPLSCSSVGAI